MNRVSTGQVFRPVQYLGSKLRSLGAITDVMGGRATSGQAVWDAFSGSSVVAQGLAGAGHRVVAHDALTSSATYAQALLGVGRAANTDSADSLVEMLLGAPMKVAPELEGALYEEDLAVNRGDGANLLQQGARVPQRWRKEISASGRRFPAGLISSTYAGTYFGVRQALILDALRIRLNELTEIDEWNRSVALTALCAAASKAVFSAGKHFAQPLSTGSEKNTGFHERRILSDRRVNIVHEVEEAVRNIYVSARPGSENHVAGVRMAELVTSEDLQKWDVGTVYADPPYTAQQYSRYYHVLDVLVGGSPVDLQRLNGEVTKGLYPASRYKSPFCSRVAAPRAFRALAETTYDAGARLVLSYSGSASRSTGNPRSITLPELCETLEAVFPRVKVQSLDFQYRQFNKSSNIKVHRNDPEVLIVAEMH